MLVEEKQEIKLKAPKEIGAAGETIKLDPSLENYPGAGFVAEKIIDKNVVLLIGAYAQVKYAKDCATLLREEATKLNELSNRYPHDQERLERARNKINA